MKILNNVARATGRRLSHFGSRQWQKKSIFTLAVIVAGFIVGLKVTGSNVFAQSNDKNISVLPAQSFLTPQVKVKTVRVGETAREIREVREGNARKTLDENFKENSDWLSRTSFVIENVSNKPIIYLKINAFFPETTSSGNVMVYPVTFGRRPGSKLQNSDDFLLKPNETLDVSLGPKYGDISRFIGIRHPIESIHRIQLEVSFIVFEDGTAWSVGTFMRQDPNNPDRYVPVETTPED